MSEYGYLLSIAIILLSTKILGLTTQKIKLPQVVGALFAGLIIGPAVLNIIPQESMNLLNHISEIGVIVLMFEAGLETDIKELKKTGLASFIIALIGVVVPLLGGFGLAYVYNKENTLDTPIYLQNLFIGIILTATSVSITVETLKELGKLSTKSGNAILGAAIIDDILGIIALTIVTSLASPNSGSGGVGIVLLKILGFLVFAAAICVAFHLFMTKWCTTESGKDLRRYVIISFVFCLLVSYCAEVFFGVADITGAFFAGVAIAHTPKSEYITSRFNTLSYLLLSPVFFASIGLKVDLSGFSSNILVFTILMLIIALLSKVIGCGLGAKMCGFSMSDSVKIGVGMISRGEVALIVANKGDAIGLMHEEYFAPIIIMVVFTTIITPIL
ncbi:MAG: cation:proton antiporter, partial [Oscillospiraceae bacterium]|nr:cation:proton antiporter [Oscillospiraceae bacterium]